MLRPKDRDAAEYGDLEALVRREVRKLALNRSLGRLDKPEPRKHSILKACSQWEPSICAFRRSRTAFRDAPEQANRLAQALMLCFLQRRFSSFFATGYGNLSAGHPTLAASTKSAFDRARNAVRLAPEYAINQATCRRSGLADRCDCISQVDQIKPVEQNCALCSASHIQFGRCRFNLWSVALGFEYYSESLSLNCAALLQLSFLRKISSVYAF